MADPTPLRGDSQWNSQDIYAKRQAGNWRLYGADTIACRLDKSELPGWCRKQVVVGPNEGAIIIRDGKAEELVTESKQKIQGFLGGLMDKLFGWITGHHDVSVVLVDLGPIRIPIYVGEGTKIEQASSRTPIPDGYISDVRASQVSIQAISADSEVISAECIMTVMLNDSDPSRIIGIMKNARALSRWDLAAMIRDELLASVLIPQIAQQKATDLRGNKALIDGICNVTRSQMEQSLRSWGLVLTNFTMAWGLNESEKLAMFKRRGELEDEAKKFVHNRRLAEMGRDMEIQRARISNMQELKVAEVEGNEKLKDLLLSCELHRQEILDGRRVAVAKVDAEVRVIQLDLAAKEASMRLELRRSEQMQGLDMEDRKWRMANEARLASLDADDKEMQSMVRMQIQMATAKHEREMAARRQTIDADFTKMRIRLEEDQLRLAQQQALVGQAISAGVMNAAAMQTFLQESTKQGFATASDAKAAAVFDAEKSKQNLETYKSAEERERLHQQDMTKLASDMMGSAKQTFGPSVVMGGGAGMPPAAFASTTPPGTPPAASAGDLKARLAKLKDLLDAGVISQDDHDKRKAAILAEI